MVTAEVRKKYTATIGIECHVQLKTVTKLFAAVGNDAREAPPNMLVSHICFGLPGALPVLNREAVRLVVRAAFALGTKPQKFSKFDRKHYFYPDLPKGYQITQYDQPLIVGGSVDFEIECEPKSVGVVRAHLEEDAGKSIHPAGKDYSLVDLNRAGTPLLEIVSKPDMHSPAEAKAYARELYLRMKYADVSDANLYYGNMRFDVNVSVSTTNILGTRSETKNLNSFRAVEKAVEYEIGRQIDLLEKGQLVVQETRGWDDAKGKTLPQRSKEEAQDYRYMPDPDLPPLVLDDDFIEKVHAEMPIMPAEWRQKFIEALKSSSGGADLGAIENLLDIQVEGLGVDYLEYLQKIVDSDKERAWYCVVWFVNVDAPLRRKGQAKRPLTENGVDYYAETYRLFKKENKLSSTNAKILLEQALGNGQPVSNIEEFAGAHGLLQVSDEGEIAKIVEQVLSENAKAAEDVKNGEMKAIGFLVGQVMKASKGKANPALAQDILKKMLGI